MSRLIGWLACLGTPKAGPVVYVNPSLSEFKRLTGYNSWTDLAKARVNTFSLTTEELELRDEWSSLMPSPEYCLRKLNQLPKHFKIGSLVFLWDGATSDEYLTWDYTKNSWYIKSYIDGRPELDNGDCCVDKIRYISTVGTHYKISNKDLFTYIMNNLDKVIAQ